MSQIDLEKLSDSAPGVPDAWYLDATGKPCNEAFRKHFKLPRGSRKAHKVQELLRSIVSPQIRWKYFHSTLMHYRTLGSPIILAFDDLSIGAWLVSPEAFAMARFDEGWHLRKEEELMSFARLDEVERPSTDTKLLNLLSSHKDMVRPAKALTSKGKTISQPEAELVLKCAVECWLRAREKLSEWGQMDAEQRTRLADVLFSGFTFMGATALIESLKEQPELSFYYQSFLLTSEIKPLVQKKASFETSQDQQPCLVSTPDAVVEPPHVTPDIHLPSQSASSLDLPAGVEPDCSVVAPACPAPESLQQLYELISSISLSGKNQADAGPEHGIMIQSLLSQHLQRLTELRERLSPEVIRQLIEHYCQAVLLMTDSLDFSQSEYRDLVPVLRSAWKFTVIEALRNGLPESWFFETLQGRRQIPKFVERFIAERAKISEATKAIEDIHAQLAESTFTVKAKLKAGEKRRLGEISEANQEIENIRIEAAHRLVPDGKNLDRLMEEANAGLNGQADDEDVVPEQLDPSSVKALQSVLEKLTSLKPAESAQSAEAGESCEPVEAAPVSSSQQAVEGEAKHETQQVTLNPEPEAEGSVAEPLPAVMAQPESEPKIKAKSKSKLKAEPDTALNIVPAAKVEPVQEALPVHSKRQAAAVAAVPAIVIEPLRIVTEEAGTAMVAMDPVLPSVGAANDEPMALSDSGAVGIPDVAEAFGHLPYADSKEAAQQAFRLGCEKFSQVPGSVIDALAMHWLDAGHLSVSYQILKDAQDSTLVIDPVLEASLLRSAFYGMNLWPKDSEALSQTQRELNLLNHKDLEVQLGRKPGGRLVPYLLVCATLQPALFAGGETQAPALLKVAANHFDGPLKQLIASTAEFTQRGGRVDFATLRSGEAQEERLAAIRLQDQVNAWLELNSQRTTGWHALRVALKICSQKPLLASAIEAIRGGASGDSAAVRNFVSTYSSHTESRRLLDELVVEIRADYSGFIDHIDSHAYTSFCQQIDALVAIAQSWLVEVLPSDVHPKEIQDFLQKFRTQLERSILLLKNQQSYDDVERRAGSQLLLQALSSLHAQISSDTSPKRFDQADAIFKLPAMLARLALSDVGPELRMEWFTGHLTQADWLQEMLIVAEFHKAHWVRFLLLIQIEERGERQTLRLSSVNADIAGTRAELKKVIDQFRNLSIQAMSVDMISEQDHIDNMEMSREWVGELSTLKPFADLSPMEEDVRKSTSSLEKLLNSNAVALTEELDQGLLELRTKVDAKAVPEAWETSARRALERRSLTVVRELLNQLQDHIRRNAKLSEVLPHENEDLTKFLAVEPKLSELLHEHPNAREAGTRVIEEKPGDLDYSASKAAFRKVIGILLGWRVKGPNKRTHLEKEGYESIVSVLEFLGFKVPEKSKEGAPTTLSGCEYRPLGDFRSLKIKVAYPALPKGFPLFERPLSDTAAPLSASDTTFSLNIIFLQGAWSLTSLTGSTEHSLPDRAVMMVGEPLSREQRKAFSSFCRDRKCTVFLLDPVILAFLASATNPEATLAMFLRVTAAWTFYNPYTKGDTRLPAPPEMRFGREHDVASLVMPQGAALVYGGRQLGKTTLLHSAEQAFKARDSRNHAYCLRMDGQFQYAKERDSMDVKTRVLELMVKKLKEDGVLTEHGKGTPEERLQAEFQRSGTTRVLFCLDEVDSILNRDARTNFQLIRSLAALVNDSNQRFRVVLAGLNNVNRFRTYPNSPLEQLGGSLAVKILPAQDARNLIVQPLASLGYRFEEPELVDRIIAFTNRHPSLLHIFCSELVEQLGRRHNGEYGVHVITQGDLENIENNRDVRRLSGDRFDMTLNLDKRYTVAVYGLLDVYGKSIGTFSVKKALEVARNLVPEEFQQMNETSFGGLLEELVGLGVLREVNHEYAIRNQTILQLIGSPSMIAHNLQVAVRDLKNREEDALTCHPTASNLIPSPLALQDEKLLLSAKAPDGIENYSVSVIMGTPALGLSMEGVQHGFSVINEFLMGSTRYETRLIPNAQALEPKRFEAAIAAAITNYTASSPAVVLVSLEECSSIEKILTLMSVANEMAPKAKGLKHRLRIVFLLGPAAVWSWHSHPALTTLPHSLGGIIELNRWTRHACEGLLDQHGLGVSSEQAQELHKATEGWYLPLMKFIEVRKKHKNATSFKDFAKHYKALADLPAKELEKFVHQTGMNSMTWSMPLAAQLHAYGSLNQFSEEDIAIVIESLGPDFEAQISPSQGSYVVRWWSALRVIEVNTKAASQMAGKSGQVTYRFTTAMERAIVEYAALQESKAVTA
jgi:hypothetical protein